MKEALQTTASKSSLIVRPCKVLLICMKCNIFNKKTLDWSYSEIHFSSGEGRRSRKAFHWKPKIWHVVNPPQVKSNELMRSKHSFGISRFTEDRNISSTRDPKRQNCLSLQIFFVFELPRRIDSYSWAWDGFIMMYRLAARESSDGNFLLKFWVIFVAITEFVFCLSNSVFSDFFKIIRQKASWFIDLSAREAYFNRIFYQGHVILWERKNFRVIFFCFFHHLFSLCLLIICVVSSRTASERLLLKFHCTWRQPFKHQFL